jgi:hypothetical protein
MGGLPIICNLEYAPDATVSVGAQVVGRKLYASYGGFNYLFDVRTKPRVFDKGIRPLWQYVLLSCLFGMGIMLMGKDMYYRNCLIFYASTRYPFTLAMERPDARAKHIPPETWRVVAGWEFIRQVAMQKMPITLLIIVGLCAAAGGFGIGTMFGGMAAPHETVTAPAPEPTVAPVKTVGEAAIPPMLPPAENVTASAQPLKRLY